jgi:hypothetical protein
MRTCRFDVRGDGMGRHFRCPVCGTFRRIPTGLRDSRGILLPDKRIRKTCNEGGSVAKALFSRDFRAAGRCQTGAWDQEVGGSNPRPHVLGSRLALLCPLGLTPEPSRCQPIPSLPVVKPSLLVPPQPPLHLPPEPGRSVAPATRCSTWPMARRTCRTVSAAVRFFPPPGPLRQEPCGDE